MAEPRRAAATLPHFEGGHFLVVEARYYEAIGADLLAGAPRVEAAGASFDLISVPGALEIPAGIAIALDAAEGQGPALRGRRRARLRRPRRDLSFRDRRGGKRAGVDGYERGPQAAARQWHSHDRDDLPQAEERADPARGDKGGDAARAALAIATLKRSLL